MLRDRKVKAPVRARAEKFATRVPTRICQEIPSDQNPYIPREVRCHGYDLMELAERRTIEDVIFLLFTGELPTHEKARLLRILMIALINPGPRHPATRAGMLAAVSKVNPTHLLPISMSVMSGDYLGAGEVMAATRFIRKNIRHPAEQAADRCLNNIASSNQEKASRVAQGFGTRFGGRDELAQALADKLLGEPGSGRALAWGTKFVSVIREVGYGWLVPGVVAAAMLDLGIPSRAAPGIFQFISGPGMLAHAVEMSGKPLTSMPFVPNDDYVINEHD